jgi:hypothetical protein
MTANRLSRFASLLDLERLFFVAMVVLHVVPIWVFPYFPSQDGPVHVFNASVIRDYDAPSSGLLREYFTLNPSPVPTWFVDLLLTALLCLVPHHVAEKVLLTAYVALFPLGMRYSILGINRRARFLSIMAFPFIYNWFFQMGFYGFSLGLPTMFFAVGYWLRHGRQLTQNNIVILSGSLIVLYLCHPLPLLISYLTLVTLALSRIGIDWANAYKRATFDWRRIALTLCRVALPLFTAFLPSLVLFAVFLLPNKVFYTPGPTLRTRLFDFLCLVSLTSFDQRELWFTVGFVCVVAFAFLACVPARLSERRLDNWDGFLVVIVVCTCLYFLAPETKVATRATWKATPNYVVMRLNMVPFVMVIFWLAAQRHLVFSRRILQAACAVGSLGLLGIRCAKYAQFNDYIAEYLSITSRIQAGATLLQLDVSDGNPDPSTRALRLVSPLRHASHYVASERRLVAFDNYQAATGYFPVLFRPTRNPYIAMGNIEQTPPRVNFIDYAAQTGGQVDYVLLLHGFRRAGDVEVRKSIDRQLTEGYDEMGVSQHGLVSLFRLKDGGTKAGRTP